MKRALIVVDVQRDFCDGGALPGADTASLIDPLTAFIDVARRTGVVIAFTQDWHPQDHRSFASEGGRWPPHCVADSPGAELTPPLSPQADDVIVKKGVARGDAGYSAFETTSFERRLRSHRITEAAVCGIATEYCVRATALDAARTGFRTVVLTDLIRPVTPDAVPAVLEELKSEGVRLAASSAWLETPAAPIAT